MINLEKLFLSLCPCAHHILPIGEYDFCESSKSICSMLIHVDIRNANIQFYFPSSQTNMPYSIVFCIIFSFIDIKIKYAVFPFFTQRTSHSLASCTYSTTWIYCSLLNNSLVDSPLAYVQYSAIMKKNPMKNNVYKKSSMFIDIPERYISQSGNCESRNK